MNLKDLIDPPRPPKALDREGRIELLAEAAQSLLANRTPRQEASFFLGSAIQAWLELGGDL